MGVDSGIAETARAVDDLEDIRPGSSGPRPKLTTNVTSDEYAPLLPDGEQDTREEEDFLMEFERDWANEPWSKRPNILWLLPPFCIFTIAFGASAVPKLNVILTLICRNYYAESDLSGHILPPIIGGDNNEQCQIPEVHARTANFILMMGLLAGVLGAFTSPRLGALSDRYGRAMLLALSCFGLVIGENALLLVATWPDTFHVNWLLVGSALEGLCGSFMLGMALSYSYASDCTQPRYRSMAFGALQGCLFLGVAIGPVLGGLLVERTGNILSVFYWALAGHGLFVSYAMCVLPESLPKRRMMEAQDRKFREDNMREMEPRKAWWVRYSPRKLLEPLKAFYPRGPGTSATLRRNMVLLATIDCVLFGVGMGAISVIIMYAEKQFGWKNLESTIYLSFVNTVRVTVLFGILPLIVAFVRRGATTRQMQKGSDMLDIVLIRFAVITEATGYMLYSLAPNGTLFTLAGGFVSLGGMGSPTIQSSLTKHIPKEKTGELLGAMALLHSLARVFGPMVFNTIYAQTVGSVPQTVFVCLASTFSIAFVSSLFIKTHVSWEPVEEDVSES